MAQLAPVCLPISTYTTSSWFSVFQFLSDSLLEPIWEVENSENECVHSKKKRLTQSQETHEPKFPPALPVVGWEEGGIYMPITWGSW